MKKCMVKPVNYDKVWDITQGKRWNLSSLPGPGDSSIQRGHQYRPWVHRREDTTGHAFYHSGYSWHPEETTKAWGWAWNPIFNLIEEAFKVYNNQDLTEETSKDKRLMKKNQLLAALIHLSCFRNLEGWEDPTNSQEATWAETRVPFVWRRDTGRGSGTLEWDIRAPSSGTFERYPWPASVSW